MMSAGGPGQPADPAEQVDLLPEGQAGLRHAGAQLRLQCEDTDWRDTVIYSVFMSQR